MALIDARYYRTLLISPNRSLASELTPLLASALPLAPVEDMSAFPHRRQLAEVGARFAPKLCMLDFASDRERSFDVLTDLAALWPGMPVVALLASNDPDLILRCMRQGATEFLIRPFTADQLDAAIAKVVRLLPPPGPAVGGHAIAVIPAKGACGATTLACNLAHQAKKRSKRLLLADLDPLTGTVSFLLKLKSVYSFLDILARGTETLDTDLWKQLVTANAGVDVLLPPEHLVEGMDDLPEATAVIHGAQQVYDTVIVDCGNPFGRWNFSAASACDEILLVATNELPSLQAAQRILAWYEDERMDLSKLKLVINRYHREAGLVSESIGKALDTEVFHVLPADYDSLQRALMEGKPAAAGSAYAKSVATLTEKLIAAAPEDGGRNGRSDAGKKKFSLFSRS